MKKNQSGSITVIVVAAIVAAVIAAAAYTVFVDSGGSELNEPTTGKVAEQGLEDQYSGLEIHPATGIITESDIARLKAELGNWVANNNGKLPGPSDFKANFVDEGGEYVGKYESISTEKLQLFELIDSRGPGVFTLQPNTAEVFVVTGAKCDGKTVVVGSSRSAAIFYNSADANFCSDF